MSTVIDKNTQLYQKILISQLTATNIKTSSSLRIKRTNTFGTALKGHPSTRPA